jgi:hypothetical protein
LFPQVLISSCHATVADFFIILLKAILSDDKRAGHGQEGYYILENGHLEARGVNEAIGKTLLRLGKLAKGGTSQITAEEISESPFAKVCPMFSLLT